MPPEQCSSPVSHSQAFPQRRVHPFPKSLSLSSCLLSKLILWSLPAGLSWIYSLPIFLLWALHSLYLCLLRLAPSPKLWFSTFTLAFILITRDNIERYHQEQRDHLYLDSLPLPTTTPVSLLRKDHHAISKSLGKLTFCALRWLIDLRAWAEWYVSRYFYRGDQKAPALISAQHLHTVLSCFC